jgi:hypothetical protein
VSAKVEFSRGRPGFDNRNCDYHIVSRGTNTGNVYRAVA